MALSERFHERARELIGRYPEKRSAMSMILHEAQEETGYVSAEVIREVAELLDVNSAEVADLVTFHEMFKRTPPGRYIISLCTNVGCAIWGADDTGRTLRELIGPEHEASPDGMFSWEQMECLAACHRAPAAQVNHRDVRYLTSDRARRLCEALRSGRPEDEVVEEFRREGSFEEAGARPSSIHRPDPSGEEHA